MEITHTQSYGRTQFSLTKLKPSKTGGLEIWYEQKETVNDIPTVAEQHTKRSKMPHPELTNKFKSLAAFCAVCFGYNTIMSTVDTEEFAPNQAQEHYVRCWCETQKDSIEVTQMQVSGKYDTMEVVIYFNYLTSCGQKAVGQTPPILLSADNYGCEAKLLEIIVKLEDECFEYLFNNKQIQPDLFMVAKKNDEVVYDECKDGPDIYRNQINNVPDYGAIV